MKKKIYSLVLASFLAAACFAQVKIGNPGNPDPDAVLDLDGSTGKGLLLPRLSAQQMNALSAAANGMMIYNTTDAVIYLRKNGNWVKLSEGNGFNLPHASSHGLLNTYVLDLTNLAGGASNGAIKGMANEGNGVVGFSHMGNGIVGTANNGSGGYFSANTGFPAIQTGSGTVCIGTATTTRGKLIVNGSWGNVSAMFGEGIPGISVEISDPSIGFNSYYINTRKAMSAGHGAYISLSPITGKFTINTSASAGTADNDINMIPRLTVTKEGNTGLQGNNNPHSPLAFADQTGNKIAFWGNAINSHFGFGIQPSLLQMYSATSADDIAFGYGSSSNFTEHMRIKGNGNIGIATNNPGYPLTLSSTSNGFVQKGGNVEIGTAVTASAGVIKTYSNHPLHFSTNNQPMQMMLTTSGDLGIGTTFPLARLHARSGQEIVAVIENQTLLDNDVETKMAFKTGNSYTGLIGTYGTGSISARMSFSTDVSGIPSLMQERMSILDNGNVGINTVNPASKLEVNGKTKVTQGAGDNAALEIAGAIKVSGNNQAAFVKTISASDIAISSYSVVIDNPLCNGDPNALLFVTARTTTPVSLGYDANSGKWKLYTSGKHFTGFSTVDFKRCNDSCLQTQVWGASDNDFSAGESFNILVIKTN